VSDAGRSLKWPDRLFERTNGNRVLGVREIDVEMISYDLSLVTLVTESAKGYRNTTNNEHRR
jgi:hypothetical protein